MVTESVILALNRAEDTNLDRLFPGTWAEKAAKMLRSDLDATEIIYETDAGIADFHSLRHTFVSNLAVGGVHPKLAQQLSRHSTITLTIDRYSHVGLLDMNAALDSLLVITSPESQSMRATGTTDQATSDFSCTQSGTHPAETNRPQPVSTGPVTTDSAPGRKRKPPQFSAENEGVESMKVSGLEPETYGLKVRGQPRKNKGSASVVAQMVATDAAEDGSERLISAADIDPDLARIVAAWPNLSAVAKRMILAALDAEQPPPIAAPRGKGVTP